MCETIWFRYACGCTGHRREHCVNGPFKEVEKAKSGGSSSRTTPPSLNGLQFPLPDCRDKYAADLVNRFRNELYTEVPRLCSTCREIRLSLMRELQPGMKAWPKRYDWKNWNQMGLPEMNSETSSEWSTLFESSSSDSKSKGDKEGDEKKMVGGKGDGDGGGEEMREKNEEVEKDGEDEEEKEGDL